MLRRAGPGGNDQLVTGLVADLPGQVHTGTALTALARRSDGTWTLTFGTGRSTVADHVVLALPFSLLRPVDATRAGFSARKQRRSESRRWAPTPSCTCS